MTNERLEELLYEAKMTMANGDTEKCLSLCNQAYMLDNENIDVLGMLGDVHLIRGDLARAKEYYSDGKMAHPNNVYIRNSLANIYFEQKDYGKSSEEIAETLEISPDDIGSRYLLGAIKLNLGDLDVAREDFEKIIKRRVNMPPGTIGRETQEISIINSYLSLYGIHRHDHDLAGCIKIFGKAWVFNTKCRLSKTLYRISGGLIRV